MTKEEKARENWKDMVRLFGSRSPEELKAYQEYISISQHQGTSQGRASRGSKTVKKDKIDKTGELEGMSFAETFDLQNPETEISRSLPQQCRPAQEMLF